MSESQKTMFKVALVSLAAYAAVSWFQRKIYAVPVVGEFLPK